VRRSPLRTSTLIVGLICILTSSLAEAVPFVFVARRAIGRVEQMQQQTPGSGEVVDTAAVIIDAPADRVYSVIAKRIQSVQNVSVTRTDEANRALEFTNGKQIVSMRVSVLGEALAHLLVSAAGAQPSPMAVVVDHILTACRELNVECERAQK
jgi:hypothetical protein